MGARGGRGERGLAMVAVLLVLMALFVMSAPFLVTLRNADQSSAEAADRALLRVTLDAQARHAAAALAGSHPALDATPYFDDAAELAVETRFPEGFLPTRDPRAPMWGIEAEDVAGRIDLASASPHVLANLIGGAARLGATCRPQDVELELSGTEGFLPSGVVYVDDEVIAYEELGTGKLARLARGLLVKEAGDGKVVSCGPSKAAAHEVGAYVIDQRAWALCEWRIAPRTADDLRAYAGVEELRDAQAFLLGPELGRDAYLALERTTSAYGHVRAGARWQRPARVLADPAGEPPYGCTLQVDDLRWFNPGTTVRITDGKRVELALVRRAEGNVQLTEPLQQRFEAHATVIAPLARRPVNVNTASPEVLEALWTNLKLRGRSARITAGEARKLVELAEASRPFTGLEDFLRRLVLPAAGLDALPADAPVTPEAFAAAASGTSAAAVIDADDALALYKNALNANDNELEFATMPLAFTSRDVYELELRAAVNAPSGVERARGVRELVEVVVPQRELLQVWTRQEELDDAPRLDRDASGWMTGPVPTSRHDPAYGEVASVRWPTRARAHLGPHDSQPSLDPLGDATPVYAFADREDDLGWAQLAPMREEAAARRTTWSLHFDDETRTLEGRFLPDGSAPLDLVKLGWSGGVSGATGATGGLMQGMAFSTWLKPRDLEEGALLLDVGGPFTDADRLSLLFEEGDLVLRVLDGAGDHPLSAFRERAEVRFPMGEGAGLPRETWSHVQIGVDGTRPDQMVLVVDGRRSEHTPGLTRLSAGITGESDLIPVESTDGFPDKCVLRIGNELIEAHKRGPRSFSAKFESSGENAGFGGRLARELFSGAEGQEINQGLFKGTEHPAGSTVQLYGYSAPFQGNVPSAGSPLAASLEAFAVGRVTGIVIGGRDHTENQMEPILATLSSGNPLLLGWGMDSQNADVESLVIEPADPNGDVERVMGAFSASGGYAALLSVRWRLTVTEGVIGGTTVVTTDRHGVRLGGVEVIRYSGYEGNRLRIQARGESVQLPSLANTTGDEVVTGRGAFVFWFNGPFVDSAWLDNNVQLSAQTMIVPISIPVGSAGGVTGFPPGQRGRSEIAQLTRTGVDAHLTEWVRYDDVTPDGHLVRSDAQALLAANEAAHGGIRILEFDDDTSGPGGGGGGGGGGGRSSFVRAPEPAPPAGPRPAAGRRQGGESIWNHRMGESEDDDLYVTRAVRSHMQFRGVFGTYSHAQPAGTVVLPAFRVNDLDESSGWPGRFDHVTLFFDDPAEPGFPAVVHRAHRPNQYTLYAWTDPDAGELAAEEGPGPAAVAESGVELAACYVALQARLPVFIPASPIGQPQTPVDGRLLARMTLFPSGELPRVVQSGQMGGDARSGGSVPSVIVDEALFFESALDVAGMPGQLVLREAFHEGEETFRAQEDVVRTTLGDFAYQTAYITALPARGGLLRIGDEIVAYDSYDADTFVFTVPRGGRGLVGTEVQPHRAGEAVTFLSSLPAAVLGANVGADDAFLPLLELPPGFPSQGLVRVDDELVHYTRVDGSILAMPRASAEPGRMDRKGPGLFRGRFGTQRAAHTAGTAIVLHPFRYWDRWSDLADAPELTYFGLAADQPDAFWRSAFWKAETPAFAGPELGVLQRTRAETPWDSPPDAEDGLTLLRDGKLDGGGNPIGVQSDRVEWRVFVRHLPGSFDPVEGLAHGWKTTPRLELFGADYLAPARTLSRFDR